MAQEEHSQKCGNSSIAGGGSCGSGCGTAGGNGRSSKKLKQKKVPQRGLGVAQLEKIRLEEQQKQQKKDAAAQAPAILSPNSIISPSNSSCLAVQCANFRHHPSPSSIPPLPPPSPTDLSSQTSIFRPAPSTPNIDVFHPNSVPLSKPLIGGGGEIGWSAIPGAGAGAGHVNWPKLWNCEYNFEGENHRLDHNGFISRSNMNLPYESWVPPNVMQRTQFQQLSSSSMVNVSSGTSSSSIINFQMEPPSNQSYYGNNYSPNWPEEEKMVGMKRSYPFSLDNPPGPSVHCNFLPAFVPPITRSGESASCDNGGTLNTEFSSPIFREGPSSSTPISELNSKKVTKENWGSNGDFLTLAPPATTLPHRSSKFKHPSAHELSQFETLHHHGSMEDPPVHQQGPIGPIQQHTFYSFLPSAKTETGQATTTRSNYNGEVGESVDLNLKL
ncbi:hypothetical protein F0562_010597 [Nyssa sinensis]|uniref:Uncharacterized protein n=1 Tax=Nyssa sinensis TaxID=561372 RepID=A0A5J5A2G3_9ASTE|nr:hypothetical protein F0562_010597 [Nyssa sinensis]